MLTKDLVRYKISDEKVEPQFIDPDDAQLLETAEQLLAVFKSAEGLIRSELQTQSKEIIDGSPLEAVITRGLEKLLMDRSEFDTAPDPELIAFRRKLFLKSSNILASGQLDTLEAYQQKVAAHFQETPPPRLAERLYSDLPDYQPLTRFRSLSPERLLHRYNCAQVQGLLIHTNELKIDIWDAPAAALRQFFKYLRFHQLLAMIHKLEKNHYQITVDGPLNLFYKSQKYGLNLANFFPALLHQPNWSLTAEVQFKNRRKYELNLDDSCGIAPYFHHFSAYVPEEIRLFQETFQKKGKGWKIEPASDFIALEGEQYCFPDFNLVHESGVITAMELFHPWHATQLIQRLTLLENTTTPDLLIGVSKVLLKDPAVAEKVEGSAYFARFGFIFREMPTLQKVLPVLEGVLG